MIEEVPDSPWRAEEMMTAQQEATLAWQMLLDRAAVRQAGGGRRTRLRAAVGCSQEKRS